MCKYFMIRMCSSWHSALRTFHVLGELKNLSRTDSKIEGRSWWSQDRWQQYFHFIRTRESQSEQEGGKSKSILDFTEQRPDTSKDSHAPSLSGDKNGWVTPADKGLEPLTLCGEGGLEDRCPEQWCTASLDHDTFQSFQSNSQCSYIHNLE